MAIPINHSPAACAVVLLGIAQDGGVPQAGCECPACLAGYTQPESRPLVACLGLIDRRQNAAWLIDATPDFPLQLHRLRQAAPGCTLRGIFITHAHIGHYTGLVHLGREAWNTRRLPVYGSPALGGFLAANAPWDQLLRLENIVFQPLPPETPLALGDGLSLTPVPVPHRGEYSDTLGYAVQGPGRRLFYCPDIDRWEQAGPALQAELHGCDVALLDGTFFSGDELPGRNMAEVPHPPVRAAAPWLRQFGAQIVFTHFNHTNPLLRPGPERDWLAAQGCAAGEGGMAWEL